MHTDTILTTPGTFVVGCNYWASHAGTAMWSDWRPDVVDRDLALLSAEGLQVLRVFPLWPDFQPLTQLYGASGGSVELRFGEDPLPNTLAGRAGVSDVMMGRFRQFADCAEAHGLHLIVGLVTGWMSGRLFVPPAFERLNVLTDPAAIMWQVRFVRHFVEQFRGHPGVLAWDLGNECNVMGSVTREAAWLWTNAIAGAIRQVDADRPIVSGMHSLEPGRRAAWRIQDQAELTDVLTTHPYPIFTPHYDQDPVNTLRNGLHATAQTCWYADIGGVPGLAEEVGTLGPFIAAEDVVADYVRMTLASLWAHNCHGLLWWCGFDQKHLTHAPYDWDAYERELGLFRENGEPKPVVKAVGSFRERIESAGLSLLPERTTDAVCILSEGQDAWGAAYSSFVLAKQAGFDLEFQFVDQPIKDSSLYFLPSVSGSRPFTRRFWLDLLHRVEGGATLYLSHADAMLVPFVDPFGVEILTRERRTQSATIAFDGIEKLDTLTMAGAVKLRLRPGGAVVLGREACGNPVFTRAGYGAGTVYFLALPLETLLSETPGVFHRDGAEPYWRLYAHVAAEAIGRRVVRQDCSMVGVTEHPESANQCIVVLINYSPTPVTTRLSLARRWRVSETLLGLSPQDDVCIISANDAVVFRMVRCG